MMVSLNGTKAKKTFLQEELKKAGEALLKKRKEVQETKGYQSIR